MAITACELKSQCIGDAIQGRRKHSKSGGHIHLGAPSPAKTGKQYKLKENTLYKKFF